MTTGRTTGDEGVRCVAGRAEGLRARVLSRRALRYATGANAEEDIPAHVRAGSALAITDDAMLVAQDDTNVLARIDRRSGQVRAIPLPRGEGGLRQFGDDRGNKKDKLDLESSVWLDEDGGTLLAFGSGSRPVRERVLVVRGLTDGHPTAEVCPAPALYGALRACRGFAGSELNVEGVARVGGVLRFFQRGNGRVVEGVEPADATADIALSSVLAAIRGEPCDVVLERVRTYDLGALDGVRLTFTDGWSDGAEPTWFLASAEGSPDVFHDGEVRGSALGWIEPDGTARWSPIEDEAGGPFRDKAEGLAFEPGRRDRAWIVVDKDDTTAPCELCELGITRDGDRT
jgi:hypothetical protein